ncbi:hypothetical protein VTO73DRAFT_7564 [Trametes versicolor]
MPRKKNTKGRARPAHSPPLAEEDRKPDILQPPSRPLQPISRLHRAELNALLDSQSVDLSVLFCNAWATERDVDPALVTDWVRRRSRRTSGSSAQSMDEAPLMSFDNIRVKRERAASPVLFVAEPAKKRPKGLHPPSNSTQSSRPPVQSTLGHGVRHTRAHDGNPHPGCATCNPSSNPALPPVLRSALSETPSPVSAGPSQLSVTARLVSRPALKSALRVSSPSHSTARVPRRVRFSHELYSEALAAYTQLQSSQAVSYAGRKRSRDAIEDEESSSAKDSESSRAATGNYSLLSDAPSTSNSPLSGDSTVSSPPSSTAMPNTTCALSSQENDAPQPQSSSPSPSSPSKRIKLSPSSILHTEGQFSLSASVPGHFNAASSLPFSPPAAQNLDLVSAVAPRTPSPRGPSGSFFSPTFFSPSASSSSGEEEVEALLASSPPTSPFLAPRSSSPCTIVSPSPKRLCSPSIVDTLERHVSPERIESIPLPLRTPSPHSLPPPADIPPRPRTPPNSGPGPGSTSNTPQPLRPPRPACDGHSTSASIPDNEGENMACSQERPFPPRPRSPPGPPSGGSRQCTPEPGRPPRPVVDRKFDGYFTKDAFIRMLTREEEDEENDIHMHMREEEEEEDETIHDLPVNATIRQPLNPPHRAANPRDEHPSMKLCTPEPVRPRMPVTDAQTSHHSRPSSIQFDSPSSHPYSVSSPSKIPPRGHTTLGGNSPRSRRPTPQSIQPTRPSADTDVRVDICASTVSMDIPTHALPLPPRVRTPPGPPVAGSQPCTPQPGRPMRPADDEAAQDTDNDSFDDQLSEACIAMVTTLGVLQIKRGLTQCEAAFKASEGIFVSADEDIKPLPAVTEDLTQAKKCYKKAGPTKGKDKATASSVKTEDGGIALGQVQTQATAKTKRVTKAKGDKKAKTTSGVEVKLEQIAAAATAPASVTKKLRKKGTVKGAAAPEERATDPVPATSSGKKRRTKGRQAGATPTDKDAALPNSSPAVGIPAATAPVHASLSRTSSLQKRDSYKGIKHPPRTCSYVPDHLQALGSVRWDADGFECMELSALPWLAGTAQRGHGEVRITHPDEPESAIVRGYEMIFVPEVPDLFLMDEEDVRVRLYAQGPLPASFLEGLGRAVSIRRSVSVGDVGADGVAGA